MHIDDEKILDDFAKTRNIKENTKQVYRNAIKNYTKSQELTMKELLDEAEKEEEEGIRLKNRTLKKRLINHRNYLINEKEYSIVTLKKAMTHIKTIYNHYEIQLPKIPPLNERNVKKYENTYFDDLPTRELIRECIRLSKPNMRAIILFICSSGCARKEISKFTIQDFIDATSEYHNSKDIDDVVEELKGQEDVVPIFKLRRNKSNKYYYTFCSPEAVTAIVSYISSRTDNIQPDSKLFKINPNYMSMKFSELNRMLGGHKVGPYNLIRSHMFRKFHASNLERGDNGLSREEINSLQGRSEEGVDAAYFYKDPRDLRRKYIANIDKILINTEVNTLTIESPEVAAIRKRNDELENNIDRIVEQKLAEKLGGILSELGYDI